MEQLSLIEVDETWREEWQNMPEFIRFDNKPFQKIIVHFKTREDVKAFATLINQRLTVDTDTIWFPLNKTPTGVYQDEP
jgi:hypothetical protein